MHIETHTHSGTIADCTWHIRLLDFAKGSALVFGAIFALFGFAIARLARIEFSYALLVGTVVFIIIVVPAWLYCDSLCAQDKRAIEQQKT